MIDIGNRKGGHGTYKNGRWFMSDEAIACANALAAVVRGLERGDPTVASAYAPERVRAQLLACYGSHS